MKIRDVLSDYGKAVVIVRYRRPEAVSEEVYLGYPPPQNPACYLQVCLDVSKVSPSEKLIRLGDTRGDEIMGWTNMGALDVVEVLGELARDGTVVPVVPRGQVATLSGAA